MKNQKSSRKKSAVSLKYVPAEDKAPRVTAKGKGQVAENIIALAKKNNIPIKEDPDLVQVLSQVEVDREIPETLYQVVAELLAFIYQVNKDFPNQPPSAIAQ